ncbi:MAG: nucleoside 2-deoxyribosyltransferase [Opitutaceae bacterium]|nr:nucleoside 2-deoxyribosyltransferase [Verrucomicrobiales bacterium]
MADSYRVYFAGELFSAKHLDGNAALAELLYQRSNGRYVSVVPQNLEQRDTTAQEIRDQDIRTLLACDVGIFHYDGPELDSGTVVEFMFAKFADIPAVLLRTDFRKGGDAGTDPWNLMTSFYPRTETVLLDAMGIYKKAFEPYRKMSDEALLAGGIASRVAAEMHERILDPVMEALDRVVTSKCVLPEADAEAIHRWLGVLPGYRDGVLVEEMMRNLARRQRKRD